MAAEVTVQSVPTNRGVSLDRGEVNGMQPFDVLVQELSAVSPQLFPSPSPLVKFDFGLPQQDINKIDAIVKGIPASPTERKSLVMAADSLRDLASEYHAFRRVTQYEQFQDKKFPDFMQEVYQGKIRDIVVRIEGTDDQKETAENILLGYFLNDYTGRTLSTDPFLVDFEIYEQISKRAVPIERYLGMSTSVSFGEFLGGVMTDFYTTNRETLSPQQIAELRMGKPSSRRSAPEVVVSEEDMPLSEEELNYQVQALLVRLDEALAPYEDDNDVRTHRKIDSKNVPGVNGNLFDTVDTRSYEDDYGFPSKSDDDLHVKRTQVYTMVDDEIDKPVNSSAMITLPERDTEIDRRVHVKIYPRVNIVFAGTKLAITATDAKDNTVGALKAAQQAIDSLNSLPSQK